MTRKRDMRSKYFALIILEQRFKSTRTKIGSFHVIVTFKLIRQISNLPQCQDSEIARVTRINDTQAYP